MSDLEKQLAERFAKDTANHVMTVLHDDGLYRHLRFRDPGSSFYWFDIVTWPGSLAIRGDCGGFMFSRTDDMFEFFRRNGNSRGINPGYWSEKLPDNGRSVHQYSEDVLRAKLPPLLDEYEAEYPARAADYEVAKASYDATALMDRWPYAIGGPREPYKPKTPADVREIVTDHDEDGLLAYEEGARQLLSALESAHVVSDTFEWDLTDWDWQYLWCCHAIAWGVAQYDAANRRPVVSVALPGVS